MEQFRHCILLLILVLGHVGAENTNSRLPTSQIQSLVRLQKILGYPPELGQTRWNSSDTDFCGFGPSSGFNISCNYTTSGTLTVTGLQILGSSTVPRRLPSVFSMEVLGNLLSEMSDLQHLELVQLGLLGALPGKLDHLGSLEILNLSSNLISGSIPDRIRTMNTLQVLRLDENRLNGTLPAWLGQMRGLRELDLSRNSLKGPLPSSLFTSATLERLSVSHNGLTGNLPEPSRDSKLVYLNAGANHLGPGFPKLGPHVGYVLLGQNGIRSQIPRGVAYGARAVRVLDLSYNLLYGAPPAALFRLPQVETLALNGNELSGELPVNLSLSGSIKSLDLSSNLFTGNVPRIFLNGSSVVRFSKNCFETKVQPQYGRSHCKKGSSVADSHDLAIIAGIIGGGVALVAAVALFLFVLLRCLKQQGKPAQYAASSCADTASLGVPSDLLSNARYLSQSIRLGVHTTSHNRVFNVPELEEATANFSSALLIGEGQHGKVYKGKLQDGTVVAIKCLTLDSRQDLRQLKVHLELLMKIRHRHLVGYIGYCLDREMDNTSQGQNRRLFLVSEYVDNGTLRNHLSKVDGKEVLTWPQRLAAVIGAGRGIQYLHTGVVPGIFNNDVNITNILMDQNCVAKFTDFGLGRHARTSCDFDAKVYVQKTAAHIDLDHHRRKLASDKTDVYNFGFVLMEIVLGRPPTMDDAKAVHPKIRELEMLLVEHVPRFEVVDSSIVGTCVAESLTTVLEIASKCLCEEASSRPSMEDVLWNLQYAAQVQDRVSGEYSEELPYVSPPRSRFNRQAIRASSHTGRRSGSREEQAPEFLR